MELVLTWDTNMKLCKKINQKCSVNLDLSMLLSKHESYFDQPFLQTIKLYFRFTKAYYIKPLNRFKNTYLP